jgi:hypothetical protein
MCGCKAESRNRRSCLSRDAESLFAALWNPCESGITRTPLNTEHNSQIGRAVGISRGKVKGGGPLQDYVRRGGLR